MSSILNALMSALMPKTFGGVAQAVSPLAPGPKPRRTLFTQVKTRLEAKAAADAAANAPMPAPVLPADAQLNSDAQAAALLAGMKRRRTAMSAGILGPKPSGRRAAVTLAPAVLGGSIGRPGY